MGDPATAWSSAWITGGSAGIGRALALRLASEGCRVAVSARSKNALDALHGENSLVEAHPLDVTEPEAVAVAVAAIEERQGALGLVILNAGTYEPLAGGLGDPALFRKHMEVNYLGVVNAVQAVLPRMIERGRGTLALMGSLSGYRGLPRAACYGPTKAAVINLAETLRAEHHGSGVDIRVVNPGFVATRLTEKNDFPMPQLMSPEEAAAAILEGLRGSGFEIAFPTRFARLMKLARLLPYRLYFPLAHRMLR